MTIQGILPKLCCVCPTKTVRDSVSHRTETVVHWAPEAELEELVGIHRMSVSPSGVVAAATLNNRILVLRPEGLTPLSVLDPGESKSLWNTSIHGVVWSADESSLIIAEGIRLTSVDSTTGQINWRIRLKEFMPFLSSSALTLTLMKSGQVALSTEAGVWQLWSDCGALIRKRKDHAAPHSVGKTMSGSLLGTDGHVITEWDGETFEPLQRQFSEKRVHSIVPCPGSPLKWWAKVESDVVLMQWGKEEPLFKISADPGLPAIAVSVDGCEVAWMEGHRVLSCVEGQEPRDILEADARVISIAYLPDGRLVSGWSDGVIRQTRF
jgi:hypothetical protein